MGVLYQHPRRPVWIGVRLGMQDLQGAIPRFWCVNCGAEVFLTGSIYCHRCEKEAIVYEKPAKSLCHLHTGTQPRWV